MGDFLAFGSDKKTSSVNTPKTTPNSKGCPNATVKLSGMPAFGSPAISYGGNQVQFGSPAITNTNNVRHSNNQQYTPRGMNNSKSPRAQFNNSYSPRSQNSYSPRSQNNYSPRTQNNYSPRGQLNYSPRGQLNYSPRCQNMYSPRQPQGSYSPRHQTSFQHTPANVRKDSSEANNFKTPQQYSPGPGRGGGKSIGRQFGKNLEPEPMVSDLLHINQAMINTQRKSTTLQRSRIYS